jgi:hypothetical protein
MPGQIIASREAHQLKMAFDTSPVAFAYYDPGDRLRFWNRAYEDLNYAIRDQIREDAYFPDLLSKLVVSGQVDIPDDDYAAWIRQRIEARRHGTTSFRRLGDGRRYLVQERKDEIGGTLGFWLNVTDLFVTGALKVAAGGIAGTAPSLADYGLQGMIRTQLQVMLGNLELMRSTVAEDERTALVDSAIRAGQAIANMLEDARAPCPAPIGTVAGPPGPGDRDAPPTHAGGRP